jgi:ubiquinone/menaquinone biosynthesis C-methylase UbiE
VGSGQGRDTLFFAQNGLHVTAMDYSETAVDTVRTKAVASGVGSLVTAIRHDIRDPFPDASFDAAFSHMLFCMAITTAGAERPSQDVRLVGSVVWSLE